MKETIEAIILLFILTYKLHYVGREFVLEFVYGCVYQLFVYE